MQPDENKSDVQNSGSPIAPASLNQTSNLRGKEALISGAPQVPAGLENVVHMNEVPELDGVETSTVSEPAVVAEKVVSGKAVSDKSTTLTQHPSITVKTSNSEETKTLAPAVTSFRVVAKGDYRNSKVDEAKIMIREDDREKEMKRKGVRV